MIPSKPPQPRGLVGLTLVVVVVVMVVVVVTDNKIETAIAFHDSWCIVGGKFW